MGIGDDIGSLTLVRAFERIDGIGSAAGVASITDVGDGAAAEDFVLFSKFEDFFDVCVDRICLIKGFDVGIAEFRNLCENRAGGTPHIFAVSGVISARESLLGAIINAWDTALEKEEGEGIFEGIDALVITSVIEITADVVVIEEVDEEVAGSDALAFSVNDTVGTRFVAEFLVSAFALIPAIERGCAILRTSAVGA